MDDPCRVKEEVRKKFESKFCEYMGPRPRLVHDLDDKKLKAMKFMKLGSRPDTFYTAEAVR